MKARGSVGESGSHARYRHSAQSSQARAICKACAGGVGRGTARALQETSDAPQDPAHDAPAERTDCGLDRCAGASARRKLASPPPHEETYETKVGAQNGLLDSTRSPRHRLGPNVRCRVLRKVLRGVARGTVRTTCRSTDAPSPRAWLELESIDRFCRATAPVTTTHRFADPSIVWVARVSS